MTTNFLHTIDKKINKDIDFSFLISIKNKLPYWNFYFFVCLAEMLTLFMDENKTFTSEEEVISSMIIEAKKLYESKDISTIFNL